MLRAIKPGTTTTGQPAWTKTMNDLEGFAFSQLMKTYGNKYPLSAPKREKI